MDTVECKRLGHHLREQGISAWDYGDTVWYGHQTFCEECQNVTLTAPMSKEERRTARERIRQDAEEEDNFLRERGRQAESF